MKRILIVDDQADILVMLRRLFEKEGYEVLEASDGNEGLELYTKIKPDLVVTDIQMPNKSGPLFIIELRQKFPYAKIIAMSGGGTEGFDPEICLDLAVSLDVNDALRKPFHPADMLKAVRKLIG